jgi:hypothetical protein
LDARVKQEQEAAGDYGIEASIEEIRVFDSGTLNRNCWE